MQRETTPKNPPQALMDFANWAANYAEKNNFSLMIFAKEHKADAPMLVLIENADKDFEFKKEVSKAIVTQPDILKCVAVYALANRFGQIAEIFPAHRERESS